MCGSEWKITIALKDETEPILVYDFCVALDHKYYFATLKTDQTFWRVNKKNKISCTLIRKSHWIEEVTTNPNESRNLLVKAFSTVFVKADNTVLEKLYDYSKVNHWNSQLQLMNTSAVFHAQDDCDGIHNVIRV